MEIHWLKRGRVEILRERSSGRSLIKILYGLMHCLPAIEELHMATVGEFVSSLKPERESSEFERVPKSRLKHTGEKVTLESSFGTA